MALQLTYSMTSKDYKKIIVDSVTKILKLNGFKKTGNTFFFSNRQTTTLLILTVIFFVVGQFEYVNLYRLTLYSIRTLSSVPLSFYGKFPQWPGDTKFSLIIASIPLTIFLCSKILRQTKYSLIISILTYAVYFICSYLIVCFWTSFSFHSLNDFYQGELIKKNLAEINISEIFLTTVILTTVATSLTFLLVLFFNWGICKLLQIKSQPNAATQQ